MSSVQGVKTCPKCGGVMVYDFDCHTTEEDRTCMCCGYHQSWYLLRDECGNIKKDSNGNWLGDYNEILGCGIKVLCSEDGSCGVDIIDAPMSDEEIKSLLNEIEKYFCRDGTYVTSYEPESNTLRVIYGKIPKDFEP